MAKNDQLKVGGQLELDVVLKNIKKAKDLIKSLEQNVNVAGQGKSKSDPAQKLKAYQADTLKYIKDTTQAASTLVGKSDKTIQSFLNSGKNLERLSKRDNSRLQSAIGGAANGLEQLNIASKAATRLLPEIADKGQRTALKNVLNDQKALQLSANKLLGEINPELKKVAVARKAEKESILSANKQRDVETAVAKQRAREESARQSLGRRLRGAPTAAEFSSLTGGGRASVKSALEGRVTVAGTQQRAADALSLPPDTKAVFTNQLRKANEELEKFNTLSRNATDTSKKAAEQKAVQAERQKLLNSENKKASEIEKAYQQVEARRQARSKQIDREYQKAQKTKLAATQAEEKEGARAVAAQNKIIEDGIVARQKLEDRARAKADSIFQKRIAKQRRDLEAANKLRAKDEIDAYKDRDRLEQQEQKRRTSQRDKFLALDLKRKIAQDTLQSGYGVKSFDKLAFSSVRREDLKSLQDYAKAQAAVTRGHLANAQSSGKSKETVNALKQGYEQQALVVRKLENRYRELHSPLQQANLLFRQFFRFAIGYGALYQALGAIKGLITGVVDLDASLRSIQAITESTDRQMRSLEVAIKRVATTTKFGTTEIAKAAQVLGQAGVSAAELPATLEATANFAASTASDLEIAADLLTTTRNVFKELDDSTLSDQLTKSVNISKLTAQDLKTILSLSAQTAKSYSLTSEQYLSAVTTLRNAGLKASTVATGLRQSLIEVFAPDTNTVKALKQRYDQLGEELSEEAVKQRFFGFTKADNPLLAVLSELKRIGFADEAQKEFQRAFDVRAANAIKALIRNYDELAASELKITFGQPAAEAAEIQMKSLRNSLDNLGAAFTVFGDAVLGGAVDSLETFADKATDALNALTQLDIELKKQGKEGLSSGLIPALAGGVSGALLGKSIKGKFGYGALGTLAGGAAGLLPAVGVEGSGTGTKVGAVAGATGLAALIAANLVNIFGKGKAGEGRQIDAFGSVGQGSVGRFVSGQGGSATSKALGKFGGAAAVGAVAKFIPYLGTLFNLLSIVAIVIPTLYSLFGDGGDDFEKAENRIRGTLADLEKAKAENEKATQAIEEYDVKAARLGGVSGKTASSLVALEQKLIDSKAAIDSVFGNLGAEESAELDGIISIYSNSSLASRKTLAQKAKILSRSEKSVAELDKLIFEISSNSIGITDSIEALVGQIGGQVNQVYDRIRAAAISGVDPSEIDLKIARLYQTSDGIRDAVLGRGDATEKQLVEYAVAYSQGIAEIQRATIDASVTGSAEAIRVKAEEAIKAEIDSAITNSEKISELDLQTQLKALVDDLIRLGDVTEEKVAGFKRVISDAIAEANQKVVEREKKNLPSYYGGLAAFKPPGSKPATSVNAASVEAVDSEISKYIDSEVAAAQTNITNVVKKTIAGAVAQVDSFSDLLETSAGKGAIATALDDPTAGEAASRLQEIISDPNGLKGLRDELEALQQVDFDTSNLKDPKIIKKGLQALFDLMVNAGDLANAALQGEADVKKVTKYLPSPDNLAQIDKLTRDITSAQGFDKSGISKLLTDSPSNPIIQRRNLLAIEKQKEIGLLQQEKESLDPKGLLAAVDPKTAKEINAINIRINKANGELLALNDEALSLIQDAKDKLNAIILKRREQAANLELKVADINIGLSGQSGDASLFKKSVEQIDRANAELLDVFRKQLIQDGISPFIAETKALYDQEVALRAYELRRLESNSEAFQKELERLTAGIREEASRLRNQPISSGGTAQDAISASYGTVGNDRRLQNAVNNLAGVTLEAQALGASRAGLKGALDTQQGDLARAKTPEQVAAANGEIASTEAALASLSDQLVVLGQEASALTLAAYEASADNDKRLAAELQQITNMRSVVEALQDSEYAFKNFAENLRDNLLGTLTAVGDGLTAVVLDGESFKQTMAQIFNDLGRQLFNDGVQTLINEAGSALVSKLPAQLASYLPGAEGLATAAADASEQTAAVSLGTAGSTLTIAGTALQAAATQISASLISKPAENAAGAVAGAVTGGGGGAAGAAIASALSPAAATQQAASISLFQAGVALDTSAIALQTAASYLAASSIPGVATGGIFSAKGISRYAKGTAGVISGPGTGTSDSIPAIHMSRGKAFPIRVANGESILTAKATDLLGEDFIHSLNAGRLSKFADGAVMGRSDVLAAGARPAPSTSASPSVTNKNETTIVNAIDSSSVVAAALETPAGGRAIMNYLRANKSKVSRIIQ